MDIIERVVTVLCCKILFRVKYFNIENIKNINRCLICPNHSNVFDPIFIYPVIENLYIMAKAELFKNRWIDKLFTSHNIFPIDREKTDIKSTMHSLDIFKEEGKKRLLMFPEGKVIKNENEIGNKYRKGAVFIAEQSEVPIIPVYITRKPLFFSNVKVTFGKPIYIYKEEIETKEKIKQRSKQLIEEIYKLKGEI